MRNKALEKHIPELNINFWLEHIPDKCSLDEPDIPDNSPLVTWSWKSVGKLILHKIVNRDTYEI